MEQTTEKKAQKQGTQATKKESHSSQDQGEQGGKQVQDYYITKQKLGKGAYGSVFIAYKLTKEGKKCGKYAAKVIQLNSLNDKEIIQLTREIEILQAIRHDNIVKMEHVTRTKNNLYIFLEYIKDGDLSKFLESKKRLSEEEAIFFFRQICQGFKELYKRNIIHRDIKPENILIDDKDQTKRALISDFGFARVLSQDQMNKQIEQTPVGNSNSIHIQFWIQQLFFYKLNHYLLLILTSFSLQGSLRYMAPQILGIINFSCKCDVWSLGVLVYECLYAQPPWMDDTYLRLLNKILNKPLVFPEDVKVSPQLKELLRHMMTIDEEKRISWDQIFLHPLLNDNYKLYSTFLQSDAYVHSIIAQIQKGEDLQNLLSESKIASIQSEDVRKLTIIIINNVDLHRLRKKRNYCRQIMFFITSTLDDLIRLKACSSFIVPEALYHKTLLLLQKQQQIVREHLIEITCGEKIDSQLSFLSHENLQKEVDSPSFLFFKEVRRQDDDNIMPFFLNLFMNSSRILEEKGESEFANILKQKLLLEDNIFSNTHRTELLKFISLAYASVHKKQNLFKNILLALHKLILCLEQRRELSWKQDRENCEFIAQLFQSVSDKDAAALEQSVTFYIKQHMPQDYKALSDSSEQVLNSALEKLQCSDDTKAFY